jgi:hypothetical protein
MKIAVVTPYVFGKRQFHIVAENRGVAPKKNGELNGLRNPLIMQVSQV